MPLHGKIVVIKRSGGDGTEFPLTASCLFGRKAECDIRIQLPSVSKEHCRIDLNENKEVILTNLSSANPTHINGKAFHQSERLKHGDIITVLDRSFRFEYPPAPTPKKTTSVGPKSETLKVLRHQQVSETITVEAGDKRQSEVSLGPHLKDGANIDNIQRSLEKTLEVESKEDGSPNKTNSPFSDLYQMIKKSLNVKTPRVSSASQVQTPSSRLCTPKSGSVLKKHDKSVTSAKKDETKLPAMPPLVKKQEKSVQDPSADETGPGMGEGECATKCEAASKSRRSSGTPQKFTVSEVLEQIPAQGFKSPIRRRSKESTPGKSPVSTEQEQPAVKSPNAENPRRTSPRTSGSTGKEVSKKRKSRELGSDSSGPKMKKKRVSFGGYLSPELFDKRLPPDSPLRKGATPRRSLTLRKSKLSLLRRASVIGFLKEKSPAKTKTPSPKKLSSASPKTSPGKKSPKSGSPSSKSSAASKKTPQSKSSPKAASPKPASPAQKSPKSRSSTPKAASPRSRATSPKAASPADKVKTPKAQRKSATPGQQARDATPDGKRRSSPGESTSAKTPSGVQTPTVQGRFSVSRISTPSPAADVDPVVQQEPVSSVTPRIQLKRKSMKSTSRKTAVSGSAVKILQRKSGVSRASMKAIKTSWANIVKFGETKTQIVAPTKKAVPQKTVKKAVSKPQTPARKPEGHVSTGHADSPATIVVGRAHKRAAVHPTGAAPRVVTNTAVLKKDMKMDEDLTGVSEMFKTPANERKRKSLKRESSAANTPVAALGTSVIEPSVLKTPEEPGEMVVSPLSLASTVKSRRYNSEAVHRLLNGDQELSFTNDVPASNVQSESTEEQDVDFKTTCVTTPKQKPELPDGLTGVKRITKTPKEKAEPVEDLRGKLLKTPKQKPEQQECLTGVKRIMKTPREKAEPVEDIRGKLLITPKQKPEQQECLTGVRRIFKTPKQKAEPLEDLRGKLLKTPKARESGEVSLDGVKELVETPTQVQKSEFSDVKTPDIKSSVMVCLTDVRRAMNTPRQKYSPVEDMIGVKRLMRTPKQKGEPVEENFGIKKLMKSPRLRGVAPVEDFEGLQELMQEPPTYQTQIETNEVIMEIQPQEAAGEAQQQPKEETKLDTDRAIKKKPVRGRKAKTVEAETKEEAPEPSEDPVAAPVRGRRGRKLEAAAPPAVRQTRRTKSVKTEEKTSDQPAVECQATGGENAQTPLPVPSTVGKPKRGRRVKPDAEEQKDFTAEIKQQPQLPVRAKRGRNVQQKEGESDIDVKTTSQETSVCLEPVKKPRRTRKAEQDLVEPEVQVVEMHIPEKAEVPAAKPVTVSEATVAPKPRRGGRKAKTGAEAAAPVKSTEVIEVPDASNEKPKRSTRGKPTTQEVVATENPEQEPEEQKKTCSPPQIIRASRARGRKNEVSQAIPAKRALRGRAAPVEETSEEPVIPVSEPTPVKPAKRGRWATAKSKAQMTTDSAKSTENVAEAAVEDPKKSKNVQFTSDVQIFEIPKETPVAVRGKKSKLENVSKDANKLEEENQKEKMAQAQPVRGKKSKLKNEKSENVSKDAKKPEEENLKEEITQAQPVRRGRRGVKAAGVPAESESQEGVKDAEAEPQPKTRRGRSAKK